MNITSVTMVAQGARITLAADLQVAQVAHLWETLQPLASAPPERVVVDASQVRRVDTAVLQALAVLLRDLRMAGCAVHWDSCSAQWSEATELTGMAGMLDATP